MQNHHIIQIEKTASTNDYLKEFLSSNNLIEGSVIITNNQVKGRGHGSNVWESEANKNLTFSLLLNPRFVEASEMFLISKVISLGIITYLNSLKNEFTIKWPNDIYWNDKKIGGILIENQLLGSRINYSIIGIGLNVNQKKFLSKAPNPISLYQIFNKSFKLDVLLNNLLNSIHIWYKNLEAGKFDLINKTYFDLLYRNGGYFQYKTDTELFKARIECVEDDGLLKLRTYEGEIKSFYFKEVAFVI